MKVLVAFGTRPEALKCFPVIKELRKRGNVEVKVCATGQHRQMLDQVLKLVEIEPDYDLNLMRATPTLTDLTNDILSAVGDVLSREQPDRVLVQGDTTTAMAATLAAFYRQIPVGHIEAGLRSGNNYSPWPEEVNRRIISTIADLHFAPTAGARDNLLKENIPPDSIHVTGNTVIDALCEIRQRLSGYQHNPETEHILKAASDGKKRLLLVTSHRRENWGHGMQEVCEALRVLAARDDVSIVYSVHPNPNVRAAAHAALAGHAWITLVEPMDYLAFVALMTASHFILTDSGGVQEEAPALGKPVLVLRDTTERPEGVEAGGARLVGTTTAAIVSEAQRLLDDPRAYDQMSQAPNPYGDGKAACRIAGHIVGRGPEA